MKYRSDIDGLRAVAILPVLAYHAGFGAVPGGYVGVDVFFVISGFLIGGIILDETAKGQFSYGRFLERRVRRIFPAFIAMLAFTFAASYLNLLPNQFVTFSYSAFAALFSLSNVWFWLTSGYFTAEAGMQPLLHTWSLGVEEQFYLFLPPLVALMFRLPVKARTWLIPGLALVSFAWSAVDIAEHQVAVFFLLPTRAWELLLGAMLAMGLVPKIHSDWLRNLAGGSGLALIAYSALYYTSQTSFPGPAALLPVLGAGLIIHAGSSGQNWIGRLLSLPPVVFIGLISYSLYLWHWPIIIFQNSHGMFFSNVSPHVLKILLVVTSIAVATLSWAVIERPFRNKVLVSGRIAWRFAGMSALAIIVFASTILATEGFASRFSPETLAMGRFLDYPTHDQFRSGTCFIEPPFSDRDFRDDLCLAKTAGRKASLLIGDSHAAHLWWGLAATHPDEDILQATAVGCKPVLRQSLGSAPTCVRLISRIFEQVVFSKRVDRVLLAGRWTDADLSSLADTLAQLKAKGISTTLYGPMVQYDAPLPWLLVRAGQLGRPEFVETHRLHNIDDLDRKMAKLAGQYGAKYISFLSIICPNGTCKTMATANVPMFFDYGHLTREGSLLVARTDGAGI